MTDPVEEFYSRVNARAERDMLSGNPVTGAHHRALETEIDLYRRSHCKGSIFSQPVLKRSDRSMLAYDVPLEPSTLPDPELRDHA